MTYSILAANEKLYLYEYVPGGGEHQLTFTTARNRALRFSPEERSHMEELMYLYGLHELRFCDLIPTINASDPFGAYKIGDLIDQYFSPSL